MASRAGSKVYVRMNATLHASGLVESVKRPRIIMGWVEYEENHSGIMGAYRIFVDDKRNLYTDYMK